MSAVDNAPPVTGVTAFYKSRIEDLKLKVNDKQQNIKRLEAQRNEYNS